jgi:thiamine biosynthesis lipoprotein
MVRPARLGFPFMPARPFRRIRQNFGVACTLLLPLLAAGCNDAPVYRRFEGTAMGTTWRVTAPCAGDVRAEIEAELAQVDAEMSTYRADSALSRFNAAPAGAWTDVPAPVVDVVDAALQLSRESSGAFDVTVGPLVDLWGFGPPGVVGAVPDAAAVMAARDRVGYAALVVRRSPPALQKTRDVEVDLTSVAEGHGVDRVAERLVRAGCRDMLVEIGGEIRARGVNAAGEPWRVGVEVPDPDRHGAVQRIVPLTDSALSTSGDYRNFFVAHGRRYSHIIDPRTGYPVDHALASVTVLHASTMWADGYSTLLLVLGPEDGWAFAVAHDLAALFIVRGESGFEERYTPRLAAALGDG